MYSEKAKEIIKLANTSVDIVYVTDLLMSKGLLGKKSAGDKGFLCPYHSEKSGSFYIFKNDKANGCKCFGCQVFATTTKLYADVHLKKKLRELAESNPSMTMEEQEEIYETKKHLELWRAAAVLSYKNELISREEYFDHLDSIDKCEESGDIPELYRVRSKGDYNSGYDAECSDGEEYSYEINTLSDIARKVLANYDYSQIASRIELNAIYTFLREATIEVRGDALLEHHREHLNKVRFMSDEYIDFYRYFSLPTKEEKYPVMKKILSKLRRFSYDLEALKISPGFKYVDNGGFYAIAGGSKSDSISIPMEDMYSNIKRIQLRPDEGPKTAWFSTPTVSNCKAPSTIRYPFRKDYTDFAKGNLSPTDIIYTQVDPETICKPCENEIAIMFTEGDYKAVHNSNTFNSVTLSTQGLTPWYNMFVEYTRIKDHLSDHNLKVTKGFILFDCDTKFKKGLFGNGMGVHRVLKSEGIDAYYITWDYQYGKGIDDVITSGHTDKLRIVDAEVFEKKHHLIIDIIAMEQRRLKLILDEELIKEHYESFEQFSVRELEEMLEKLTLANKLIRQKTSKELSDLKPHELEAQINIYKNKTLDELRSLCEDM